MIDLGDCVISKVTGKSQVRHCTLVNHTGKSQVSHSLVTGKSQVYRTHTKVKSYVSHK